ncbi:hypothetical protein G6F57_021535 [Rhizopus arrhizus]|nr:hypothetical protein G6F57_021535 [Rhizopus arrhizus]
MTLPGLPVPPAARPCSNAATARWAAGHGPRPTGGSMAAAPRASPRSPATPSAGWPSATGPPSPTASSAAYGRRAPSPCRRSGAPAGGPGWHPR